MSGRWQLLSPLWGEMALSGRQVSASFSAPLWMGTVTAFQMPSDFIVNDMTVDADNNLWVTETGTNKIGRIQLKP